MPAMAWEARVEVHSRQERQVSHDGLAGENMTRDQVEAALYAGWFLQFSRQMKWEDAHTHAMKHLNAWRDECGEQFDEANDEGLKP